ncbi:MULTISPECIES: hypothetical protein [Vibrio harveyi group]|uniref:Uncharacterized protein n=1 Tax=Vibrio owensii CAIM 1854 = LMG 25443 TaxID=1229493 RepID=A0A0C1WA37_9VIBR|nr:hypothetical protein [Vibrio owensii]KIF53182.1 hypothetical protein H735_09615 [Vibrio owensii CAIM 1854 = LMG 25443]
MEKTNLRNTAELKPCAHEAIERKIINIIVREHSFTTIANQAESNRLLGHIENFQFAKFRADFHTFPNNCLETTRRLLTARLERKIEEISSKSNLAIDLSKLYRL